MIKEDFRDIDRLYQYYTKSIKDYDDVCLEKMQFMEKLINSRFYLVAIEKAEISGFLSIAFKAKDAYISLLLGSENDQLELLDKAQKKLKEKGVKRLWVHFFNPVTLPWRVSEGVYHPGKPGVKIGTKDYEVYCKIGLSEHSFQELYYLPLEHFQTKYLFYNHHMVRIDLYDATKHQGFEAFTRGLDAPHWEKMLLSNQQQANPLPLIVALDDQSVIGFAGPLKVTEDGRGWFGGIGLLPNYRGQKIGKYLFGNLCFKLKDIGARYMTLFTGRDNVARYIYEATGFQVKAHFVTMKKEL